MPRCRRLFVIFSFVLGLSSCHSESHVEPSFYYWKTKYALTETDSAALQKLGVRRLFVRFFDVVVDYDEPPHPVGRLENAEPFPQGVEIIPVIFITNRTFMLQSDWYRDIQADGEVVIASSSLTGRDSTQLSELAENLVRKTLRMAKRYTSEPIRELQLDCDWSQATRNKYFYFISEVKRRVQELTLSATIRLHQFKYADRTGVPPADRGMLMYYNMSDLQDTATRNYILDNDEGEKYLTAAREYPLPLDFALPIHSQGAVFTRYDHKQPAYYSFKELLTAEQFFLLQSREGYLKPIGGSKYLLKNGYDLSTEGHYSWLSEGSIIRYDEVSDEALIRAAKHIAALANTSNYRVVFFHLDSLNLNKHSSETLAGIIDQFN